MREGPPRRAGGFSNPSPKPLQHIPFGAAIEDAWPVTCNRSCKPLNMGTCGAVQGSVQLSAAMLMCPNSRVTSLMYRPEILSIMALPAWNGTFLSFQLR